MKTYRLKYRRGLFWKTEVVIGHTVIQKIVRDMEGQPVISKATKKVEKEYDNFQDKLVLFYKDGSVKEIKQWSKCEISLGSDYRKIQEENIAKTTGHTISTNFEETK
jgi:hypothetical protein